MNGSSYLYGGNPQGCRLVSHGEPGAESGRNAALVLAWHDLVACMDDDDIMLPGRLAQQAAFLMANSDVSVVRSWANLIDGVGKVIGKGCPEVDPERTKAELNARSCLEPIQPATTFR